MAAYSNRSSGPTTGFTLIEVLVAVTLFSLLALMSWRGIEGLLQNRLRITSQTELQNGLQRLSDALANDSRALQQNLPFAAAWQQSQRVVLLRSSVNSWSDDQTLNARQLQRIEYEFDPQKATLRRLIFAASPLLQAADMKQVIDNETTIGEQLLLQNVRAFAIEVRFSGLDWQALSAQNTAPSVNAETPQLPNPFTALRLRVDVGNGEMTKVIALTNDN